MKVASPSLYRRLLQWVGGYGLLLMLCVFVHGYLVNEFAERLLWDSLLKTEFEHFRHRHGHEPGFQWSDTDSLRLYADAGADGLPAPPTSFEPLPDGIHDGLEMGGRDVRALRRTEAGHRYTMVLDITELEREEDKLAVAILAGAITITLLFCVLVAFGLRRALRPLDALASEISRVHPDRRGQRLREDLNASSELRVISGALNDYLARNDRFVERERAFIDSASHELRTPVAVIANAAELAGKGRTLDPQVALRISAIRRATRDMERLIMLLLVLAKDPALLAQASDRISLGDLLSGMVDDYRVLAEKKGLEISLDAPVDQSVLAPMQVVQAAIGNLLRNAIENSNTGTITVRLLDGAVVEITDPGQGMSPEQISAIYARLARGAGGERDGGGIGLDLIARLCEHLGWRLSMQSTTPGGTVARLSFDSETPMSTAPRINHHDAGPGLR